MTELKPCPCGGTAFLFEQSYDYGETYQVECPSCCIHTLYSETKEGASSNWNDHAMHTKVERFRDALREISSFCCVCVGNHCTICIAKAALEVK